MVPGALPILGCSFVGGWLGTVDQGLLVLTGLGLNDSCHMSNILGKKPLIQKKNSTINPRANYTVEVPSDIR